MIIKQKYYICTSEITEGVYPAFRDLLKSETYNNGHAFLFEVEEEGIGYPETAYPKLNAYLHAQGLKKGDEVVIHCNW